jgi:hypothetical protein
LNALKAEAVVEVTYLVSPFSNLEAFLKSSLFNLYGKFLNNLNASTTLPILVIINLFIKVL